MIKNLIGSPEIKDSTVMNESIGVHMREYMYINKISFFFFPFSAKVIFIFRSQYIFYSSYTKRLHIQNTWGFRTILSFIRAMFLHPLSSSLSLFFLYLHFSTYLQRRCHPRHSIRSDSLLFAIAHFQEVSSPMCDWLYLFFILIVDRIWKYYFAVLCKYSECNHRIQSRLFCRLSPETLRVEHTFSRT